MIKPALFAALVAFALPACSPKAQNDTAQAADSVAADANATMRTAVNTVDAATDRALGTAKHSADQAGADADNAGDRVSATADKAGQTISHATDKAAKGTGRALKDAGNTLEK